MSPYEGFRHQADILVSIGPTSNFLSDCFHRIIIAAPLTAGLRLCIYQASVDIAVLQESPIENTLIVPAYHFRRGVSNSSGSGSDPLYKLLPGSDRYYSDIPLAASPLTCPDMVVFLAR